MLLVIRNTVNDFFLEKETNKTNNSTSNNTQIIDLITSNRV